MKTLTRIISIILLALSLNACTHNNGDIGDLFGTWKLQSITINGESDSTYQSNVLWKFQSSIISMVKVDDTTHSKAESWGTWSYSNDDTQLVLDFTHTDNNNPNVGSSKYSPFPETHLWRHLVFSHAVPSFLPPYNTNSFKLSSISSSVIPI